MRSLFAAIVVVFAAIGAPVVSRAQPTGPMSPYVPQMGSAIRGLSQQEVEDLRDGHGAGFARMGEMNGYPGPIHALELRDKLGLTDPQVKQVEDLRDATIATAKQLGEQILEREARLSAGFARRKISEGDMKAQVSEVAELYGRLRAAHLRAHMAMLGILSSSQIAHYNMLRGYTAPGPGPSMPHQHP